MFKTIICLMMVGVLQANPIDAFKKEMAPLQTDVDRLIVETGSKVMSTPRAALIDGYGVVVVAGVAFESPSNPLFPSAVNPSQLVASVQAKQKDIKSRISAMIVKRVASMESIGPEESLTIVIQLENYNPTIVKNLPAELIFTVKKSNPQAVITKEF